MRRTAELRAMGYNVREVWEHQISEEMKSNRKMKKFFKLVGSNQSIDSFSFNVSVSTFNTPEPKRWNVWWKDSSIQNAT